MFPRSYVFEPRGLDSGHLGLGLVKKQCRDEIDTRSSFFFTACMCMSWFIEPAGEQTRYQINEIGNQQGST